MKSEKTTDMHWFRINNDIRIYVIYLVIFFFFHVVQATMYLSNCTDDAESHWRANWRCLTLRKNYSVWLILE